MHTEEIGALVVDSAMKVHSALGPRLLESAYRACPAHELGMRGSTSTFCILKMGSNALSMDYEDFLRVLRVLRGSRLGSSR